MSHDADKHEVDDEQPNADADEVLEANAPDPGCLLFHKGSVETPSLYPFARV